MENLQLEIEYKKTDIPVKKAEYQSPFPQDSEDASAMPLAALMRPSSMAEYVGQKHLLSPGMLLRRAIDADRFTAIILWGAPGIGKTTLAELIAKQSKNQFIRVSGVSSTVADMRKIIAEAIQRRHLTSRGTLVFIDEIHRWSRAQQDVLLPDVERGNIRLIGATTENPHFYVVGPLLSRALVFQLDPLSKEDIEKLLTRGCNILSQKVKCPVNIDSEAIDFIAQSCEGDGRKALSALEIAALSAIPLNESIQVTLKDAQSSMQKKIIQYGDDGHYDTASAFIKSMRGSDPDAAIYWLAKMLHAGEDIRFIARRILIFAAEDVGNADPRALQIALSAMQACEMIGMPEARIILSQAVTYCATAPKSNATILAIDSALADIREGRLMPVPFNLRDPHCQINQDAPTQNYIYPHQCDHNFAVQEYLGVQKKYYIPKGIGYESKICERMTFWDHLREKEK